uniref:Uncharacterized protein n=1 Tax=Setaria digitata TaxID=48799 RepID=A0A915PVM2_9BILA
MPLLLATEGVQGWWHPGFNYGYGYALHHPIWYHHYGGYGMVPHHPLYVHHVYDARNMHAQYRGAQIGAALGSLAANLGRKK